jgi:hypothetical protein
MKIKRKGPSSIKRANWKARASVRRIDPATRVRVMKLVLAQWPDADIRPESMKPRGKGVEF